MELPPVLIVANPYEAELCRKALAPTGISVAVSDGGEDLQAILEGKKLAVVVASGLYLSEADEVVRLVIDRSPDVPVLLIAEDEHELAGMRVRQRFYRPVDAEQLAHAIERLAVELEGSEGDPDDQPDIVVDVRDDDDDPPTVALSPQPIPRLTTERLDNVTDHAAIVDVLPRAPTAWAVTPDESEPSGARRLGALLRVDEALLDALPAIEIPEPRPGQRYTPLPDRPTPIAKLNVGSNGDLSSFDKSPLLDDIDLDAIDVGAPRLVRHTTSSLPAVSDAQTKLQSRYGDRDPEPEAAPPASVVGPDEEGELAYVDIADLLARLCAMRWNGRLLVERSDGGKSIYFEDGLPVAATSDFASDRLGDILHRDGKLNRDQHARTRQLQPAHGKSGANRLCETGLLKQREIFELLRRHTEEVFYSLFAWEAGVYRLRPQVAAAEDRVRPGQPTMALLLEGVRRKYSLERLSELTGPIETVLHPTTELQRIAGELVLTDGERRAIELFDGDRSLRDILFAEQGLPGGLSEPGLYALAWFLLCVGGLQVGEAQHAVDTRGLPTQVTPASVGRVRDRRERGRDDGSENEADRAIERERILAKLDQLGDADYFSILGVERHATSHEIRRAYERLAADFAAKRFSVAMQTELGPQLTEIGQVLHEALRVLTDEALRSSYRSNLVD